jgi:hypothetical protein
MMLLLLAVYAEAFRHHTAAHEYIGVPESDRFPFSLGALAARTVHPSAQKPSLFTDLHHDASWPSVGTRPAARRAAAEAAEAAKRILVSGLE